MRNHFSQTRTATGASSALLAVAAIQILLGFAGLFMLGWDALGWSQRVVVLSGVVYLGLSFVARRAPMAGAVIGGSLFLVYLAGQAMSDMNLAMGGLIYKVPVAILLVVALIAARKHRRMETETERIIATKQLHVFIRSFEG